MSPTPLDCLSILAEMLNRTPMTKAEQVGAQLCVNTIKAALEKPKGEPPETTSP